jgi:hypothetical protein
MFGITDSKKCVIENGPEPASVQTARFINIARAMDCTSEKKKQEDF